MDTTDSNVVPLGRHPTADELMARARALVPVLQERAQRCEDQRRVPEETIQDFERAGLLRMCQPARYGGYEMGWDVLCDLADVLAAADGSQAWLQHIYRRSHRAGRDLPGAGAGRGLGQEPQRHHLRLVRSGRARDACRRRLRVLRAARILRAASTMPTG